MVVRHSATDRIEVLLDRVEPELRRAFLRMVERIKDERTLSEIAVLLERRQYDEALSVIERHVQVTAQAVVDAYVDSGKAAAEFVESRVRVSVAFDSTNPRAVAQIRASKLGFVREVTREQVAATRLALEDGISRGLNPREQARAFRDSIGLTKHQEQIVQNYRADLERGRAGALTRELRDKRFDRTVAGAVSGRTELSQQQIDKLVDIYRKRWVAFHAETIARTHSLSAVHQGTHEMYKQAIETGDVDARAIERSWLTASDGRVRESHMLMNGQTVGIDEPFTDGDGNQLLHPGDPTAPDETTANCRCVVLTRLRPAA